MKNPAVYILASKRNGTLYIGVTSNLVKRVWQHKNKAVSGFTEDYRVNTLVYFEQFDDMYNKNKAVSGFTEGYRVNTLVYFEQFDDMYTAITREKQLKTWGRAWKISLIEKANPNWNDLYDDIV